VHKADVTLPVTELAVFVARVEDAVSGVAPGSTTLVFGHLADGNLHVNIVGPPPDDDRPVDGNWRRCRWFKSGKNHHDH
jgi:FAD/FMN-containing dehydrogenase